MYVIAVLDNSVMEVAPNNISSRCTYGFCIVSRIAGGALKVQLLLIYNTMYVIAVLDNSVMEVAPNNISSRCTYGFCIVSRIARRSSEGTVASDKPYKVCSCCIRSLSHEGCPQ